MNSSPTILRALTLLVLALSSGVFAKTAKGQLSIAAPNTTYEETFGGFEGLGLSPSPGPGMLDSNGWKIEGLSDGDGIFGGHHETGDFARGTSAGGESTGGLYALVHPGLPPALFFQSTGSDLTPGTVSLRLRNDSGQTITELETTFDLWVLNDGDRASRVALSFLHEDGSERTQAETITPAASTQDATWQARTLSADFTGLTWAPRDYAIVSWHLSDSSGAGSRDEIALSRVTATAQSASLDHEDGGVPVAENPEAGVPDSGAACTTCVGGDDPCVQVPLPFGVRCGNQGELCDGDGSCVDPHQVFPPDRDAAASSPVPSAGCATGGRRASDLCFLGALLLFLRWRRPR